MKNSIIGLVAIGALGLGLTACNGGATSVPAFNTNATGLATPLPTNPTTPAGAYVQIELLSRPAVKEALESFNNHKITNKVEPYVGSPADPLQAEIKTTENTLRPPKSTPGGPADYGTALQKILYPNELAVDLASADKASYLGIETGGFTGGKFGGRDVNDDVINIDLGALFGNVLPTLGVPGAPEDNQENACLSSQNTPQRPSQAKLATFPYLNLPH